MAFFDVDSERALGVYRLCKHFPNESIEVCVSGVDRLNFMRPGFERHRQVCFSVVQAAVPNTVVPSWNITVPVGVPEPLTDALTVAVSLTGWLAVDEIGRASCREREAIAIGGGGLKKKDDAKVRQRKRVQCR